MKLCVKKVYCPSCRKLANCREQITNNTLRVVCSRCGGTIWTKEGTVWKYTPKSA